MNQFNDNPIYALAAASCEQGMVCYAARETGLFRSDDHGATWENAYTALQFDSPIMTTAVVLSPEFATDRTLFAGGHGGILRSFDGGSTWHLALLPAPPPVVSALAVSPNYARDGTLLAATLEDGIFRSTDRGASWAWANFGLLDLHVLALAYAPGVAGDGPVFAATESGMFRSTNGGRAWRELPFSEAYAPVLTLAVSPDFVHDQTVFVGTEANGLFCSYDRGSTWAALGSFAEAINAIECSPHAGEQRALFVLCGAMLMRSYDGGQSWIAWPDTDDEITAFAAPSGLTPGSPLILGYADGAVKPIIME